jgi:hypothetical protein
VAVPIYFARICFAMLLATSVVGQTVESPPAFEACGVNSYSLSGPDWLDSVKVDIIAKLPASAAGLSPKDRALMMQPMLLSLLAERFKLKVIERKSSSLATHSWSHPGAENASRGHAPERRHGQAGARYDGSCWKLRGQSDVDA